MEEKKYAAEIYADDSYDDANELNTDRVVVTFITDEGEALLFDDGSLYVPINDFYGSPVKPNKEIEINRFDHGDGDVGIRILNNRYEDEIGGKEFNSSLEKTYVYDTGEVSISQMDHDFNEEGYIPNSSELDAHFSTLGLPVKEIKEAAKSVGNEKQESKILNVLGNLKNKLFGSKEDVQKNSNVKKNKM